MRFTMDSPDEDYLRRREEDHEHAEIRMTDRKRTALEDAQRGQMPVKMPAIQLLLDPDRWRVQTSPPGQSWRRMRRCICAYISTSRPSAGVQPALYITGIRVPATPTAGQEPVWIAMGNIPRYSSIPSARKTIVLPSARDIPGRSPRITLADR
jgi:hypothetical protein